MLLSREELDRLAAMDPTIGDYLAKNPRPPVDLTNYEAMRLGMKAMEDAFNNAGIVSPVCPESETYHEIQMRDGYMSRLKIHRPMMDVQPGPIIALLFGGGFVAGSVDQFTRTARALVKLFGVTVVSISYRLAPEYKFPTAQYDAWDSMKWIADNATGSLLHSSPDKGFIIGGVSAGGALTASLSRSFQDEPLAHPLTGQWLCIPSTMDSTCIPEKYKDYYISAEQQADGPFLSRKAREMFKKFAEWDSSSPLRYAVNSKTPVSEQPPTYFQVDGMDPLRDDSLIYHEMLGEAGVQTKIDIYPGCPHGHFHGFIGLEITDRANVDTILGFGWLLGRQVSREDAAKELGL